MSWLGHLISALWWGFVAWVMSLSSIIEGFWLAWKLSTSCDVCYFRRDGRVTVSIAYCRECMTQVCGLHLEMIRAKKMEPCCRVAAWRNVKA